MARVCDFAALRCILVILNTFYIVSIFTYKQPYGGGIYFLLVRSVAPEPGLGLGNKNSSFVQ